jgi:hypothetical protein
MCSMYIALCNTYSSVGCTVQHLLKCGMHCATPVQVWVALCNTHSSVGCIVQRLLKCGLHCAIPTQRGLHCATSTQVWGCIVQHLFKCGLHCAAPTQVWVALCNTYSSVGRYLLSEYIYSTALNKCVVHG